MITDITYGDITDPGDNPDSFIIGMNPELAQASAIGRPFTNRLVPTPLLKIGSVLTFQYDNEPDGRLLHMVICHHLGENGWLHTPAYLKCALDQLWLNPPRTPVSNYGIVKIGCGPVGQRDGARSSEIFRAMAESFLPLIVYIHRRKQAQAQVVATMPPLKFLHGWSPQVGALPALAA